MGDIKKIVLAYSGGLDTSVILRWLVETYKCEVVAFVADVGQGEEVEPVREKALRTGATTCLWRTSERSSSETSCSRVCPPTPSTRGATSGDLHGATPHRQGPDGHGEAEGADVVSHGATGKGNDQVRFELTYYAIDPTIRIIAPWREWTFRSRTDLVEYAKKHGIPTPVAAERPYSSDRNLFHISFEGGILEIRGRGAGEDSSSPSRPRRPPSRPTYLRSSRAGSAGGGGRHADEPGNALGAPQHDRRCERHRPGGHGGNRYVGMKSRGVYETPGGTILQGGAPGGGVAHHGPRSDAPARLAHPPLRGAGLFRILVLARDGGPAGHHCGSQKTVTGTARLKLYKGNCDVVGRSRPPPSTIPPCDLRGGPGVQPGGCHRLHPAERPTAPDPGPDTHAQFGLGVDPWR